MIPVCLSLFFLACNNDEKSSVEKADSANQSKEDRLPDNQVADESSSSFLVDAANGGMAEVEISKLVNDKSTNAKVKSFATMMVNDHTGVNGEVKSLAAKKNITLPADMSNDKKEKANELSNKTAADFDKAYMQTMVSDHKATIDLFEKASNNVKDAEVKSFIDATLPKLRSHLEMAQDVSSGLKK